MLRFYLERAARHGTLNQTARAAAHQLLDSLDDGYQLRFTQSGLIFDLARTGTDQETDGEVEFHRIGWTSSRNLSRRSRRCGRVCRSSETRPSWW